jgi:hypothetical protein
MKKMDWLLKQLLEQWFGLLSLIVSTLISIWAICINRSNKSLNERMHQLEEEKRNRDSYFIKTEIDEQLNELKEIIKVKDYNRLGRNYRKLNINNEQFSKLSIEHQENIRDVNKALKEFIHENFSVHNNNLAQPILRDNDDDYEHLYTVINTAHHNFWEIERDGE